MKAFRKIQTIVSIVSFFAVFLFCWYVTGFNMKDIQLSKLGINETIKNVWNISVIFISISMYMNVNAYIKSHIIVYKEMLSAFFCVICILLGLTAIIDMKTMILHTWIAVLYFLLFPLFIYVLAFFNRKRILISEWKTHIKCSLAMVIVPVVLITILPGLAIGEMFHVVVATYWNIYIMKFYKK